jgi:hypothetical protein
VGCRRGGDGSIGGLHSSIVARPNFELGAGQLPFQSERRPIELGLKAKKANQMDDALHVLLDSGWLYLALGAALCIFLGVGAVKHLFQGAKRAEPRDPED